MKQLKESDKQNPSSYGRCVRGHVATSVGFTQLYTETKTDLWSEVSGEEVAVAMQYAVLDRAQGRIIHWAKVVAQ